MSYIKNILINSILTILLLTIFFEFNKPKANTVGVRDDNEKESLSYSKLIPKNKGLTLHYEIPRRKIALKISEEKFSDCDPILSLFNTYHCQPLITKLKSNNEINLQSNKRCQRRDRPTKSRPQDKEILYGWDRLLNYIDIDKPNTQREYSTNN